MSKIVIPSDLQILLIYENSYKNGGHFFQLLNSSWTITCSWAACGQHKSTPLKTWIEAAVQPRLDVGLNMGQEMPSCTSFIGEGCFMDHTAELGFIWAYYSPEILLFEYECKQFLNFEYDANNHITHLRALLYLFAYMLL